MMREYLTEGDLISAEVQSIFTDGQLALHTRSLKYGKVLTTPFPLSLPPFRVPVFLPLLLPSSTPNLVMQ